jgi:hypothetical protein
LKPFPVDEAVPATDFISAERKFTEVCVFARPLAELVAPPTMRQHAEMSSTMIADLGLPHHTLAQQFEGMKKAMRTISPTIAPTANPFASAKKFAAAQPTTRNGSRPICGRYF